MELLSRVMKNISGITIGALLFMVGELAFSDPSVFWFKNLFTYGGVFIVIIFLSNSFRQFVEGHDPNYGGVPAISEFEEHSKNASNAGKARAFDWTAAVFAVLFAAFSMLEASWEILTILMLAFAFMEMMGLYQTYIQFQKLWDSRK